MLSGFVQLFIVIVSCVSRLLISGHFPGNKINNIIILVHLIFYILTLIFFLFLQFL